MLAYVSFVKWSPPRLTDDQEQSLGVSVSQCGVALLTFRFICLPTRGVLASGVTKKQVLDYWGILLAYLPLAIAGGATGEWANSVGNRSVERLGAILRGGAAKPNTAISGNSATTTRA